MSLLKKEEIGIKRVLLSSQHNTSALFEFLCFIGVGVLCISEFPRVIIGASERHK
jgi:hypothetical protein